MTVPGYPTEEQVTVGAQECPTAEILDLFIRLELEPARRQSIRQHVEHCGACQTALDQASDCEIASASLRPTILAKHDPAIKRLVEGLCQSFQLAKSSKIHHYLPIHFEPTDDGESLGRLNQFLIRRELASGATGTVFEALDTLTDQSMAIKFIRSSDPHTLRRVEREARATQQVHHPSVVSIQSVETAFDGRLFLVMPLVAGRSLADLIQDASCISFEQSVAILLQVASGLAEVHRQGLLHRDIKPANIVVDASGSARLTDFGLASFVEEESTLTESGVILGTPAYMSPEQARNDTHIDSRSDIYSLGATLYECLTGTRPFRGQVHDILRQIAEREPVRPQLIQQNIPRPLEAICLKAMSKPPNARYATVEQLIDDLQRWQQGKRVSARVPGLWHHFKKWIRREPKLAVALATVAATLMAGIAFSWHYWSRSIEQSKLAASRFDASLQTINTLADLTSQSLSGDPGLASIRKQVQTMADKAFEPLVEMRPSDAPNLVRYLKAMDNLGTIKHSVAGPADALAFRQRIIDDNRQSLQQFRAHDPLRREWASLHLRLAGGHIEMQDFPKATQALDKAIDVLQEQAIQDQLLMARVRHSRGTIHMWVNNDSASAAPEFRKAVELAKLYATAFPDDQLGIAVINNSQGWLADCELQLGNVELAEKLLRELHANYAVLADPPDGTYLYRLEKGRAAFALMNLLVTRGEGGQAIQWSQQVEPELQLLQASNPTLMETSALKIGFDCHIVAAELLNGNVDGAMDRIQRALTEAAALRTRFPNTTRTWQVHGHARQMWFIAAAHVADYPGMISFLRDWIQEVDQDINQQKNVGFNQKLKLSLLMNLAIAFDWKEELTQSADVWKQVLDLAPEDQKPAYQLLSQIAPFRASLRNEEPQELELMAGLDASLSVLEALYSQGIPYPTSQYSLAEGYAMAVRFLERKLDLKEAADNSTVASETESSREQIQKYRQAASNRLQTAQAAGFYRVGNRLDTFRSDPLFADDGFQTIVTSK